MVSIRDMNLLRKLLIGATVITFILIVLGGMLRVSQAGGACPDWPTCFGRWTPPAGDDALLNYLHRAVSGFAVIFLLAAAWVSGRISKLSGWVRASLAAALFLLLVQIMLGWLINRQALAAGSTWISAVHLGFSLLIQAAFVLATVISYYPVADGLQTRQPPETVRADHFNRLSRITVLVVFVLLVSGVVVRGLPGTTLCAGWPFCTGVAYPVNLADWVNVFHRSTVLVSGWLVLMVVYQAWKTRRNQTPVIVSATAAGVLFFAQSMMGVRLAPDSPMHLLALHQATAVAVWSVLVILAAFAANEQPAPLDTLQIGERTPGGMGFLKDLLMLTKPIVVLLLLVTTYAGMVIGGKAWPSLELTIYTLLGGFMAAGGSGAINQYIDRSDDQKMQRTQKRPIPAGRLTPGEGLAFGVGMALASFYLMVSYVNLLAALLTLTGIIYYVVLYSLLLKKTTVQNIVIGGGAGAIPPLVGWAAVTGSLNIPALFLFAVVFLWTPPHFWALALVRKNDYARAGVPMLPVVRGELETRRQILIYTLELVALTFLLPLFGLGGSVYLVGALALGGWLIATAWKVWKLGGNKLAWKMYRYSSMYLAFLFMVLMVDALL